jgi:8-oxo-dGTP diphosphatase
LACFHPLYQINFFLATQPSILPAGPLPGVYRQWHVYSAQTQARQEDIVLGEGQAMVFTPLERVLDLDLIPTIRLIVERFLEQANK